jgi:hypothetical protein
MDIIITIDLAFRASMSGQDIFLSMVDQMLLAITLPSAVQSLLDLRRLAVGGYHAPKNNEKIIDILKILNCVVIIKGLNIMLIYLIPLGLWETPIIEAIPLTKKLLSLAKDDSRPNRCHIVFTQRRTDPQCVEHLIGHRFRPYCYELAGLDMSDAIELSNHILKASGEDTSRWKHEDSEWLETTITLLQGIPLALPVILPLQRKMKIP